MNRSEVNYILKQYFNIYTATINGKKYTKMFTPTFNTAGVYINEKIYISGVNHCYLCTDELVLRDKYAMMQVNIKYRNIESIKIFEHYDD